MNKPDVRRIVTGHDDNGRAVILSDGPTQHGFVSDDIPGFGSTVAWMTDFGPIDHVTDHDPASTTSDIPTFPAAGQTIFRIADFPPDAVYPKDATTKVFSNIDGHDAQQAGTSQGDDRHFWFHRTDSLDYAVVLEGEITLLVDEGETTVRAGDVIVQRATNHSWSNRTDRTARLLFVLIGTEPIEPAAIAELRKRVNVGELQ